MTVETRIFRGDTWTVNTITASKLGTAYFNLVVYRRYNTTGNKAFYMGIKVWKVALDGTKTLLSGLDPVAAAYVDSDGNWKYISGTWSCPETVLVATDAIYVEIWYKWSATGTWIWTDDSWITEQLGTTILNVATWTVYYSVNWIYTSPKSYCDTLYDYDDALCGRVRIENFTYGEAAAPKIKAGLNVAQALDIILGDDG